LKTVFLAPFFNYRFQQKAWLLLSALCLGSSLAWADNLNTLDLFLKNTKVASADFVQTVVSPGKSGADGKSIQKSVVSNGYFAFKRPQQFIFQYKKPSEQLIVADGKTLWTYDSELNQVSSQKQAAVLSNSPAGLIASASSIKGLEKDYILQNDGNTDGLDWIIATPKNKEGAISRFKIGLKTSSNGVALVQLQIQDNFGKNSSLVFNNFQINPGLKPDTFTFTPPKNAEVYQQ
jgi:outer membrane lipoprotein carrier protein